MSFLLKNNNTTNTLMAERLVALYPEPMAYARQTINNLELINQLGMMTHTTLETDHLAQIGFLHLCQDHSVMTRFYDIHFNREVGSVIDSVLYNSNHDLYSRVMNLWEEQQKERVDMIKRHHQIRIINRYTNDAEYHKYLVQRDSNSLITILGGAESVVFIG